MTKTLSDTWHMTMRHVMELLRQPVWIFVTLVQPIIWLLLFGALFETVTEIPGFGSDNYIEFLTPGVVMMTAFFSSGWSGMGIIEDLNQGILDRFLVTSTSRSALINGRLVQSSITVLIQTVIIFGLALITGASFAGGVLGVAACLVVAVLIGAGFGALSNAMALITRKEETLIALMQFLLLPLTFLSVAFMQADLMPGWMQTVADFNPVNWSVEAGREALSSSPDWAAVAGWAGLLAAFFAAMLMFALRAFKAYQRSV
jgi:ABC-2 type transport system permease protein